MHPLREKQLLARLNSHLSAFMWRTEDLGGYGGSKEYLEMFKKIDPTSSGKYVPWLVNLLLANDFLGEDAEMLHELLQKFHRFKNQLPVKQRDILQHTKGSLATALKDFQLPEGTRSQLYEKQILEGMQLLHQDNEFKVIRITTPEAAREIAKGTAWCVSSLKVAADYIASGPLILIEKFDPQTNVFDSFALAHHGYKKLQSHVEADPEYHPTSQVKDTEDQDYAQHDDDFKLLQPYLQMAFNDVKIHRMRKFADAYDLHMYQEDIAEGRGPPEQRVSFDWSTGHGQLENDEEYFTRLIDLASKIFGGRDAWVEEKILNSNDEQIIFKYIQETGTIDPQLEAYLKTKWIIENYIQWAYAFTKGYQEVKPSQRAIGAARTAELENWQARLEDWLALATRMRAKI